MKGYKTVRGPFWIQGDKQIQQPNAMHGCPWDPRFLKTPVRLFVTYFQMIQQEYVHMRIEGTSGQIVTVFE